MKLEWFEIKEIKDLKKLKIIFILFSPILFLCFMQVYFALLMFLGGPLSEIFEIDTNLLFRIQYGISAILGIASVVGVWRSYRKRKINNLDPTSPFMM